MLTNHMICTIQNCMIKPITDLAISQAVQQVSIMTQKAINNNKTILEEINIFQMLNNMMGKHEEWMEKMDQEDKEFYKEGYDALVQDAKEGKGNLLHLLVLVKELEARGEKIQI